jgi:collagenase-like PrtC family protease
VESFPEIVREYADYIGEVYFAWVGASSGRAAAGKRRGFVDWGAQGELEEDLRSLREMGIELDLLLNANCYGGRALSQALANEVRSVIAHIADVVGMPDAVTTTSPAVAYVVHNNFPEIDVRASVNMRIGSPEAMRHLVGLFDSFYLQRDYQRNIAHAERTKRWSREHGLKVGMLANSGCLRFCPGQTFHDNAVAHDSEIDEMKNIPEWTPHVCWNRYADRSNWPAFLQSTWVRPEDISVYADTFDFIKLATRLHSHPRMVIHAYATGEFPGNLMDIMEPALSRGFAPYIIDNRRFPEDWLRRTCSCDGQCLSCGYCDEVLQRVCLPAE